MITLRAAMRVYVCVVVVYLKCEDFLKLDEGDDFGGKIHFEWGGGDGVDVFRVK